MPIVFVHGVNNRDSDDFRAAVAARNALLRQIVAPALGLSAGQVQIENPYWGGDGVKFAWKLAVLPNFDDAYEKFGADDQHETLALMPDDAAAHADIVEYARQDFAGAVDLLFGSALQDCQDASEADELAKAYLAAVAYAKQNPHPGWLDQVTAANFADVLCQRIQGDDPDHEAFGDEGSLLDRLKEGVSRIGHALPNASGHLLNRLGRKNLNAVVTRFAGDAFVYLDKRGEPGKPGPIVQKVLDGLHRAQAAKTAADHKLVVIAHSFGGEIMYDILTRFDPAIEVDVLVTVGSQVGLFEEMKCYLASDATASPGKVARPKSVKRWLNVFDLADVFSYRVEPVFEGVEDFQYDSGFGLLQAHGGYFVRPSFYRRLAERLAR